MTACARSSLASVGLLALVGLGPLVAAHGQEPQAEPRELRVMTYNIKHGQTNLECEQAPRPSPDCGLDLQASIDVMGAHGADIIGVQEVDRFWARSAFLDEPAEIAAGLGMAHHCYAANLDHAPDSHSDVPHQYGTAIVSRFPILSCSNTLLPRTGNQEQRGLTLAVINVDGVPLQFYNTHLHHRSLDIAPDRALQTVEIGTIMDEAPAGSKVLVGDFNAIPTADEMAPILARFFDAWAVAGIPTADNPEGFTSSADLVNDPTRRIDYVFVSSQVVVAQAYVPIDADTRLAADHYPVVADISLPGSEVGVGREVPPGQ